MWASFSATTKFSIVAFGVALGLGLISMGALGYGLYYIIRPVLGNRIEELGGDTLWPSTIFAGMAWSLGFLIAGLIMHFLAQYKLSILAHYLCYGFILWSWALLVWWVLIEFKVVK